MAALSLIVESISDDADPFRLGLGGTSPPSLGAESFEGRRGVNECVRVWTWPPETGVSGGVPLLTGEEAADRAPSFCGGEDDRPSEVALDGKGKFFWVWEGAGDVVGDGTAVLLTLSARFVRYCSILSWKLVSIGVRAGVLV